VTDPVTDPVIDLDSPKMSLKFNDFLALTFGIFKFFQNSFGIVNLKVNGIESTKN